MPGALSKDLRQRVALAYDNGEGSYAEPAERFQIGIATVKRWMWRRRDTGDIGTLFANNGPKPVCSVTTLLGAMTTRAVVAMMAVEAGTSAWAASRSILSDVHMTGCYVCDRRCHTSCWQSRAWDEIAPIGLSKGTAS